MPKGAWLCFPKNHSKIVIFNNKKEKMIFIFYFLHVQLYDLALEWYENESKSFKKWIQYIIFPCIAHKTKLFITFTSLIQMNESKLFI